MNKEKTWLTCQEAAVLLKCTPRSVLNYIKNGKISAERDESGQYFIQKSEFFRVYPDSMRPDNDGNAKKNAEKEALKFLEEKIRHLEEMVSEKNKHNVFLTQQLTSFTEEKSKMLDAINSHARLLEHKESSSQGCLKRAKSWVWPFKKR
ncbi:TPA: helix-turn-helix domain-containing protein [Legionella anisa]|uniref:helix-turn-helix domain-containing protein n=1 Tax=Legionella anisa TaxID=28082 RepID=UPI002244E256|nr:helix-turn-helix domain-containing protein [Legionella anisa]MCW8425586.1 helix-turn-helix domain-containing protein [Legionella anisa]MCW8448984.1 helix-turn-helix domain-containing protein [Legionella anisa]